MHEEVFLVLEGRPTMVVDGVDHPLREGSFVRLDPEPKRTVRNDSDAVARVLIVSAPDDERLRGDGLGVSAGEPVVPPRARSFSADPMQRSWPPGRVNRPSASTGASALCAVPAVSRRNGAGRRRPEAGSAGREARQRLSRSLR